MTSSPLLHIDALTVGFRRPGDMTGDAPLARALRGVSLTVETGDWLGLVGESGCGKSLTSLAALGLLPPAATWLQGNIFFQGQCLNQLPAHDWRKLRGQAMALIPQDPLTALNPVYTIGDQLCEVMQLHLRLSPQAARRKAVELMERVQIPDAKNRLDSYPHEFSGGMRQRVMIAMALSCNPQLLIADEPTTALDVTVQAQILALLRELQQETGLAILFITHDLGVVAESCRRVAVMYAGQVVEEAPTEALFATPQHPYTQGLLASIPNSAVARGQLRAIDGQPPSPMALPAGCAFHPRCPQVLPHCRTEEPPLKEPLPKHPSRCWL